METATTITEKVIEIAMYFLLLIIILLLVQISFDV